MLVKGQNRQWGVNRTDTWLRLLSLTWYGYKCIPGSCLFDIFLNVSFPIKFNWSAAIPSCLSNEPYNRVNLSLLTGFDMVFTGGISAEGFRKLIPALLASHNIITVFLGVLSKTPTLLLIWRNVTLKEPGRSAASLLHLVWLKHLFPSVGFLLLSAAMAMATVSIHAVRTNCKHGTLHWHIHSLKPGHVTIRTSSYL